MEFTPTGSKVAHLGDRLKPRPARATQQTSSTESAREVGQSSPEHADGPRSEGRRAAPTPGSPVGDRQISFLISPDLRDALRRRVATSEETVADVILDAIEHSHPHLPGLLAAQGPRREVGPIFVRTRRPKHAPIKVPVNVRLTGDSLSAIDSLVSKLGADSRTALIAVALRDYLLA